MISFCTFLVSFLFGYTLQALGCALAIHALGKRRVSMGGFCVMVLFFSIATLIIRKISIINFGFHTILVVIACVLIAVIVFRFPIYSTALAMLISIISIMAFEIFNYMLMTLALGKDAITTIMAAQPDTFDYFVKTVIGVPTNVFLVLMMSLVYLLAAKKFDGKNVQNTVSTWLFNKEVRQDIFDDFTPADAIGGEEPDDKNARKSDRDGKS